MTAPKVFISYAWASKDGDQWVLELAEDLVENGVHIILDQWDLREGQDAFHFMEQSVVSNEINKVIIISDKKYCERAENRVGGAGAEAQILSPKIYSSAVQTKFVACPREFAEDGTPAIPAFYSGRIYIDFTSDEARRLNFEKLLRWIFDKPLRVRPALGQAPKFEQNHSPAQQSSEVASLARLSSRIKEANDPKVSLARDGLKLVNEAVARIREPFPADAELHELVAERINATKPLRDATFHFIDAAISEYPEAFLSEELHKFFESLLSLRESYPKDRNSFHKWETDPIALLTHEFFLFSVSCAVGTGKRGLFRHLVDCPYFPDMHPRSDHELYFLDVRPNLESLDHRNQKMNLRRISLHADFIHDRCRDEQEFSQLMEADALLYLESLKGTRIRKWYPLCLVYWRSFHARMPFIRRAKSKRFALELANLLGFDSVEKMKSKYLSIEQEPENLVIIDYARVAPSVLLRLDEIATIN